MAISNERFTTLFLNWWETVEKDMTLSDMEDICKDIGMTRGEFIELVSQSNEFISKDGWTPEPEANEKVNTETGEGIFWKEYTEDEDTKPKEVNVGDSDQAIFETALTQIGINYECYSTADGDNFVELRDENKRTLGIEIYFDVNGNYTEILR